MFQMDSLAGDPDYSDPDYSEDSSSDSDVSMEIAFSAPRLCVLPAKVSSPTISSTSSAPKMGILVRSHAMEKDITVACPIDTHDYYPIYRRKRNLANFDGGHLKMMSHRESITIW